MYTWILAFFTVFLKNRNIISKIKRSKVTDYAALTHAVVKYVKILLGLNFGQSSLFIRQSSYFTPAAASTNRIGSALPVPSKYVNLYFGVADMLPFD